MRPLKKQRNYVNNTTAGDRIWLSAGALASKMNLPRIERVASEDVGITADTALRLGKALGPSPQLWLNLQNDYDLQMARREIGKSLEKIEPVIAPADA